MESQPLKLGLNSLEFPLSTPTYTTYSFSFWGCLTSSNKLAFHGPLEKTLAMPVESGFLLPSSLRGASTVVIHLNRVLWVACLRWFQAMCWHPNLGLKCWVLPSYPNNVGSQPTQKLETKKVQISVALKTFFIFHAELRHSCLS